MSEEPYELPERIEDMTEQDFVVAKARIEALLKNVPQVTREVWESVKTLCSR